MHTYCSVQYSRLYYFFCSRVAYGLPNPFYAGTDECPNRGHQRLELSIAHALIIWSNNHKTEKECAWQMYDISCDPKICSPSLKPYANLKWDVPDIVPLRLLLLILSFTSRVSYIEYCLYYPQSSLSNLCYAAYTAKCPNRGHTRLELHGLRTAP